VNSVEDKPHDYTGVDAPVDPVETPGTCNYIGPDPCFGVCDEPLMSAYDMCADHCTEVS